MTISKSYSGRREHAAGPSAGDTGGLQAGNADAAGIAVDDFEGGGSEALIVGSIDAAAADGNAEGDSDAAIDANADLDAAADARVDGNAECAVTNPFPPVGARSSPDDAWVGSRE